jgi:hypothetical protein
MDATSPHPINASRRSVLQRGAKLAYVAPVVVAALKADPALAQRGSRPGSYTSPPKASKPKASKPKASKP